MAKLRIKRNRSLMPVIALTGMLLFLLTGCGGENAGISRDEAEGVSGAAVSGEAVAAEHREESKYPYKNDDNFYMGDDGVVTQYRLDGTVADVGGFNALGEICWVDNEWIYYSVFNSKRENSEVWRAPIVKESDGNHVKWDEAEELFEAKDYMYEDCFYVNEKYIVYQTEDDIYRYDFEGKKTLPLGKKAYDFAFNLNTYISAADQGISFLIHQAEGDDSEDGDLYYLDLEKWKTNRVYSGIKEYCGIVQIGKTAFFCMDEKNVWKYEVGEEKAQCFIQKNQLKEKIDELMSEENGGDKPKYSWRVYNMDSYGERMYLTIDLEWEKEEIADEGLLEGQSVSREYSAEIMFSCDAGDASDLRYEEEISQCAQKYSRQNRGSSVYRQWITYYSDETGEFMGIIGENMFMILYDHTDSNNRLMGCYNLETGKFSYLTKEDKEFYYPYYVGWKGYMEWFEED